MQRMALCVAIALGGCGSGPKTSTVTHDDQAIRFCDVANLVANHMWEADPDDGVSLGLHKMDGLLPDRTPAGLEDQRKQLERDRDQLRGMSGPLTPIERDERDVLLAALAKRLFNLVDLDAYRTNPMSYAGAINLDAYIIRDYAPASDRTAAVAKLCTALPAFLAQARTNLVLPMPRPWIDTALLQFRGLIEFADVDVRRELPAASPALDTCKAALAEHVAWLEKQQSAGTQAFRLGTAKFVKMLADTQGVAIDLPRLQAIADADLARNLAALDGAAHAIDPARSTAEVVAQQAADRPTAAEVLAVAQADVTELRAFLIAHHIVTVPGDADAVVRASPPFQRWNAAFMDSPGPFETKPLPSFYYISPPDPSWPPAEQAAYIPPRADLLFTTVHEVYPGHFLHHLHRMQNHSRILQAFCTYSMSEGWAHYVEEMMFDAGAGGGTPQAHIGMLKEALLRNVRFVATLGLHTGDLTVDGATALFQTKGFVDAGNARQQAVRGTFDPMYLAYTLGKLMIKKLAADWLAAHPGASLGEFHDAFLTHGCAPIPVIRRDMLGNDSPAL